MRCGKAISRSTLRSGGCDGVAVRADKGLVVLTVAALSTLSWWLPLRMGPTPAEPVAVQRETRHIPDFFLNDFELTSMDRAGAPRYRLHAGAMTHYANDDTADVTAPQMTLFRGGAAPWLAHSARGWVAAGGEMVRLNGDVVITRPVTGGAPGLEVSTDELEVWPDREYAETARPVTLRDALGVTEAVGLHADFKQDRFELPAQVRGIYAPP